MQVGHDFQVVLHPGHAPINLRSSTHCALISLTVKQSTKFVFKHTSILDTTSIRENSLLSLAWLQKKLNSRALLKCPKLGTGHEEPDMYH